MSRNHQEMDFLHGPKVMEKFRKESAFSFLSKYYYTLYQSLIPNYKLTLSVVRQRHNISDTVEKYILSGRTARACLQRILNILILSLDTDQDYERFIDFLNAATVLADLPQRMIKAFSCHCSTSTYEPSNTLPLTETMRTAYCGPDHCCPSTFARRANHTLNNRRKLAIITSNQTITSNVMSFRPTNHSLTANKENTSPEEAITQPSPVLKKSCKLSEPAAFSSDQLSLATSVDVLCTHNLLTYNEVVDIIMADDQTKKKLLNDKLATVTASIKVSDQETINDVNSLPLTLTLNEDFSLLRSNYSVLLQSFPEEHCQTLNILQHKLTDDVISFILNCTNSYAANKTILDYFIDSMKCRGDLLDLCDVLDEFIDSPNILCIAQELRKDLTTEPQDEHFDESRKVPPNIGTSQQSFRDNPVPSRVNASDDCIQLKTHYHAILQLMPDNYEQSVEKLQNYISDDQICMILSSSNSTKANKIIFDCLIERMSCREELLDLCDQLETISTSHQLNMLISEIRSVLAVLKKNYTRLWHCLPQNYVKTVEEMRKSIRGVPSNYLDDVRVFRSPELINEAITGQLMSGMKDDCDALWLCDIMDDFCDSVTSKQVIANIRNEILEDLCSPLSTITTANISLPDSGISSSSGSHYPTTVHQTSNESSVEAESTPVIVSTPNPSGCTVSRMELQDQLKYDQLRIKQGIKCPPPPPLPPNYVCRQQLLDEMVTKLCQSTIDPNSYGTSLTVTGAGGFGKTSIATALCHHPVIKEQFKDGVVFIELGPQATDPSMKLKGLYNLLSDEQCDINVVEQQINQLTSRYCRNLLVVIDDVWHVEDAEQIVKAFSNCKIVLTTRMNDIEQYIPTKQVVSVGPMKQSEAISLLTCRVIDISQLSQEDVNSLDELAQDVHLWPLLLSLVRGQLSHSLKQYHLPNHEAIQNVQTKLCNKGLTALDKNNIKRSRKYAVKFCIEVTLDLLTKTLSNKIKSLILWTGIGTSLPTVVLQNLWKVTEFEARDSIDQLWAYGLVQLTDITSPMRSKYVEVHALISQYFIENMNSHEAISLSPVGKLGTSESVKQGLANFFEMSHGLRDNISLNATELLNTIHSEIENHRLILYLKLVNMYTILDPHFIIEILTEIKEHALLSTCVSNFQPLFGDRVDSLIKECQKLLKNAYKLSRKLNQTVHHCLCEKNYQTLLQTVKCYSDTYRVGFVAQKAVILVEELMSHCDDDVFLQYIREKFEKLQTKTPGYHDIALMILPSIKQFTRQLDRIQNSLQSCYADIERAAYSIEAGEFNEDNELLRHNQLIELQKVAPNYVYKLVSNQ
ncbi:uncharacterized protein [Dysidea avara]|uniref:uncharacterized protein isoform X2 n=1 Tax=Dysidea avara TaxID=196820 RepID=UPI0033188D6E